MVAGNSDRSSNSSGNSSSKSSRVKLQRDNYRPSRVKWRHADLSGDAGFTAACGLMPGRAVGSAGRAPRARLQAASPLTHQGRWAPFPKRRYGDILHAGNGNDQDSL